MDVPSSSGSDEREPSSLSPFRALPQKRGNREGWAAGVCGLASPQHATLDDFFAPRKSARLGGRVLPSQDALRHIRHRGYTGRPPRLTGYFSALPQEVLEQILGYCTPRQLAALETTCWWFVKTGITDRIARHHLRDIPRAKGMRPNFRRGESYVTVLSFVNAQSNAAAQGTAISLGAYHTLALLCPPEAAGQAPGSSDYSLHSFGRGFHGQLGLGAYACAAEPSRVPSVDRDRRAHGAGTSSAPPAPVEAVQLAVVSAGSSHSASISRRGELFTWGLASSGELGHGGWTPIEVCVPRLVTSLLRTRVVSVAAGANHTLAISESGQLWSCGRGRLGQLGHGHFRDEGVLTLVEAIRAERVVSAAAGAGHSVALAADGKLFTWGDARRGQLGHAALVGLAARAGRGGAALAVPHPQPLAALDPVVLRPPARVTAIAAGGDHTMAVTVGGTLLAFGCNKRGQLGVGDTLDRLVPTQVALGDLDILGGMTRGGVVDAPDKGPCMEPQPRDLGAGPFDRSVDDPAQLREVLAPAGSEALPVGAEISMGSRLLSLRDEIPPASLPEQLLAAEPAPQAAALPAAAPLADEPEVVRAVQIACGAAHSVLLVHVQGRTRVLATGSNAYGQLGLGDRRDRLRFAPLRALPADAACVAAGESHCAAVGQGGGLWVWGRGDCGQLGLGDDRGQWEPRALPRARVVHPDRTLRRNRKTIPKTVVLKAADV